MEGDLVLPSEGRPSRGLYVECEPGSGAAILIRSDGSAELGDIRADGAGYKVTFSEDRKMAFGQPAKFRLLLQQSLLEFYLDDILIECFSLPKSATGRIGLICGGDTGSITGLRAWRPCAR